MQPYAVVMVTGVGGVCQCGRRKVAGPAVPQVPGGVLGLPFLRLCFLLRAGGDPHQPPEEADPAAT